MLSPYRRLSFIVALLSVLCIGVSASAMEISYTTLDNQPPQGDPPSVTVTPSAPVLDATLTITRSGTPIVEETYEYLTSDEGAHVEIEQREGTQQYRARLEGMDQQGGDVDASFEFELRVSSSLDVTILRDEVDLDGGQLPIEITQPAVRIELQIDDEQGQRWVDETLEESFSAGRVDLQWPTDEDRQVGGARITVHHPSGQWVAHTLEPFSVELPQQVIGFETGTADLEESEIPKLGETREELASLLDEHGDSVDGLRLYVAGYTDTVGPAETNLQLSQQRARAIARWFDGQGIDIPIYFQGFGQEALAVDTPDNTEEEANRRAVYILGNTPPSRSEDIPRDDWRRLP